MSTCILRLTEGLGIWYVQAVSDNALKVLFDPNPDCAKTFPSYSAAQDFKRKHPHIGCRVVNLNLERARYNGRRVPL